MTITINHELMVRTKATAFTYSNKGNIAVRILSILVVAIITSALVLILVQAGLISVKAEYEPVEVLNVQFLPLRNYGYLEIKDFSFCSQIDDNFNCQQQRQFKFGDNVYFKYQAETTALNGQVMIVKNYRIKNPSGKLLLDASSNNNFYVNERSPSPSKTITFKDFFTLVGQGETGGYTLELILENPLIEQKTILTQEFEVSS